MRTPSSEANLRPTLVDLFDPREACNSNEILTDRNGCLAARRPTLIGKVGILTRALRGLVVDRYSPAKRFLQ